MSRLASRPRLLLALIGAVGATLFGAALGGMTQMDAQLAASVVDRAPITRYVVDDGGAARDHYRAVDCPGSAPRHPEV